MYWMEWTKILGDQIDRVYFLQTDEFLLAYSPTLRTAIDTSLICVSIKLLVVFNRF